ncbi:MAG: serine hydrolase [Acidimicrobiales bacterium]
MGERRAGRATAAGLLAVATLVSGALVGAPAAPVVASSAPTDPTAATQTPGSAVPRRASAAGPCADLFGPGEVAWFEAWYGAHDVTASVFDERTGCRYDLAPDRRNTTASVFKISMMGEVLLTAQDQGRGVSAHEDQLIWPMISRSDDASTNQLLSEAGGPAAMNAFYARTGMGATRTAGWVWGADTTTSARDQVELTRQLLGDRPGTFSASSRAAATHYFGTVVPEQRWGIGAGLPAGWSFLLKNGFYPSSCCGWRINSVGRVGGPDGGYDVAILTDQWGDQASGVRAVEDVARAVNAKLARRIDAGALPSGGPVAVNSDGRFEAFGVSPVGGLYNTFQLVVGQGWTGWYPHAGSWPVDQQPSVVRNAEGRLELFAVGTDGQLRHSAQNPIGGGWTAPEVMGSFLAFGPAAARGQDGRLELFAVGTDGQLWHTWQTTAAGGWAGWWPMASGLAGPPAVGTTADGRLIVGAVGADGVLRAAAQTAPSGGWTAMVPLASGVRTGRAGRPAFARQADGRLEVAVLGADRRLAHATQVGFGWSALSPMSAATFDQPPAMGPDRDGRLELVAADDAGRLVRHGQDVPGGGWTAPSVLGVGVAGAPTLVANADGRLEVFAVGQGRNLTHAFEVVPNGAWSVLYDLGGILATG